MASQDELSVGAVKRLPAATDPLDGTELIAAIQAGRGVRATVAQITAAGGGGGSSSSPTTLAPTTFANLPAPATAGMGARGFVTDSFVWAFGGAVTSGGGNNKVPIYSDGDSWIVG